MLNVKNAVLLWNPGTEQVKVMKKPLNGAGAPYSRSGLGCYAAVQKMNFEERKTAAFIEAVHLIVRDKCDPLAVHTALMELEEYRAGCAGDMPGMKEGEVPLW